MLNQTMEKEKHLQDARARMPYGLKRLAIAGICLSIITAGTAVAHAAGVLKPVSEVFREIFHLEKETAEIAEEVGSSLNISDTSGDVSITADAILGDSYNFAVVFSIQKKDGTAFKKADMQALADEQNNVVGFRQMHITAEKITGNRRGNFRFYDANPDDSSYQMLYTCATETGNNIGTQVTAAFTDFGYHDSSHNFVPIAEGNWEITFPLNYEDSSRHFGTDKKIKQDGKTITVEKAYISPVGFHVNLEVKNLKTKEKLDEITNIVKHLPLQLVLTDGKNIDLNKKNNGLTILKEDSNSAVVSYGNTFQEIIPIEQMESLRIGDLMLDF